MLLVLPPLRPPRLRHPEALPHAPLRSAMAPRHPLDQDPADVPTSLRTAAVHVHARSVRRNAVLPSVRGAQKAKRYSSV